MTPRAKQILKETRALLRRSGVWVQDRYMQPSGNESPNSVPYQACLVGALGITALGYKKAQECDGRLHGVDLDLDEAMLALSKVEDIPPVATATDNEVQLAHTSIVFFNDRAGRTKKEVLTALDKAIGEVS